MPSVCLCEHLVQLQILAISSSVASPQALHERPRLTSVTQNPGVSHSGQTDFILLARSMVALRIFSMRVGLANARRSFLTYTIPLEDRLLTIQKLA